MMQGLTNKIFTLDQTGKARNIYMIYKYVCVCVCVCVCLYLQLGQQV